MNAGRGQRVYVGELVRRTRVGQKTLSHHLGLLRAAGLLFDEEQGRRTYYEINPDAVHYQRQNAQIAITLVRGRAKVAFIVDDETPTEPAK